MRGYVAALLVVASLVHADDGEWDRLAERDGILIEGRRVGDSSTRELRATTRSPVTPATFMATLWKYDEYPRFLPYLKHLDVLRDDGDAKLIYEQVHLPLLKDRDAVLRVTRTFAPDTGTYDIVSRAVADEGPPESRDYVRVRTSLARWHLAPAVDGGTAITYAIETDAAGRVPAWLFVPMQKNAVMKALHAMLERARQNGSGVPAPGTPRPTPAP